MLSLGRSHVLGGPARVAAGLILNILLLAGGAWLGISAGCTPEPAKVDKANLPAASQQAKEIGKTLTSAAGNIKAEATAADKSVATQPAAAAAIAPHTQSIRDNADVVTEQARQVDPGLRQRIERAESDLNAMTADRDAWQAKYQKLKSESDEKFRVLMFSLAAACAVAGGVVLGLGIWARSALGITLGIMGLGLMGLFLAAGLWYVWFALGSVAVLAGVILWLVWRSGGFQKAFTEVTQLAEHLKEKLAPEVRAETFGIGTDIGKIQNFLSDPTISKVDKVRADGTIKLAAPAATAAAAGIATAPAAAPGAGPGAGPGAVNKAA